MIGPATSLGDLVQLLYKEGKTRVLLLTALFSVVAVVALGVGMTLPKKWDASATIRAEDTNIMKPLMEGRAVTTSVTTDTAVVTQVVLSRKILREVLMFGGWLHPPPAPPPDPRDEEKLLFKLRGRIRIDSPRDGLIRVGYNDTEQKRSADIANKLAEIYVRESSGAKERESREAFDFIDRQVTEYGQKLTDTHEKVLAYYRGEPPPKEDGQPEKPRPKVPAEELAALRAEEVTLAAQLGVKPRSNGPIDTRAEERARQRLNEVQGQLDRMLVTYTDEHPDVRRLKRELAAAQDDLTRVDQASRERDHATQAASALDDQVAAAARARLDAVRRRIAAISGARAPSGGHRRHPLAPDTTGDPEMRSVGQDTKLSELLRRYEATRDIYQDLLKRRENARVSMLLDAEGRGLTLRIQEAAEMPVIPSSLRLSHIVLIGLMLAAMAPLGLLLAIVSLDRRVRSARQIERMAQVPLLVSINYTPARRDANRDKTRIILVALMLAGVFAVYLGAAIIKLKTT